MERVGGVWGSKGEMTREALRPVLDESGEFRNSSLLGLGLDKSGMGGYNDGEARRDRVTGSGSFVR